MWNECHPGLKFMKCTLDRKYSSTITCIVNSKMLSVLYNSAWKRKWVIFLSNTEIKLNFPQFNLNWSKFGYKYALSLNNKLYEVVYVYRTLIYFTIKIRQIYRWLNTIKTQNHYYADFLKNIISEKIYSSTFSGTWLLLRLTYQNKTEQCIRSKILNRNVSIFPYRSTYIFCIFEYIASFRKKHNNVLLNFL